jgi:hypothetical protein
VVAEIEACTPAEAVLDGTGFIHAVSGAQRRVLAFSSANVLL